MATKKLLFVKIRAGTSDARFHKKNLLLPIRVFSRVSRHLRTGADEAHVSQQNVDELGEFVDLCFAQPFPEWRDPRVSLRCQEWAGAGWALVHGSKLEDLERPTKLTDSHLPKERRPGARELNKESDEK